MTAHPNKVFELIRLVRLRIESVHCIDKRNSLLPCARYFQQLRNQRLAPAAGTARNNFCQSPCIKSASKKQIQLGHSRGKKTFSPHRWCRKALGDKLPKLTQLKRS